MLIHKIKYAFYHNAIKKTLAEEFAELEQLVKENNCQRKSAKAFNEFFHKLVRLRFIQEYSLDENALLKENVYVTMKHRAQGFKEALVCLGLGKIAQRAEEKVLRYR